MESGTQECRDGFLDKVRRLLPPDFTERTDVRINGQVVPFLALSPEHGAVAVLFPDCGEMVGECIRAGHGNVPRNLNSAAARRVLRILRNGGSMLRLALAMPDTLRTPADKYAFGSRRRTKGLLAISAILDDRPCLRALACPENPDVMDGLRKGTDGRLETLVRNFLADSTTDACGLEIGSVMRNAALWTHGVPGGDPGTFDPDSLNARQRLLVRERTKSGFRRIKGSSGCGKSLVLAARGARLVEEGRKVLFLTFNIVAARYLSEMTSSMLRHGGGSLENAEAEFQHFHGLLGRFVPFELGPDADRGKLHEYMETEWCSHVMERIDSAGMDAAYDAILVDEGQDLRAGWWDLVRLLLRPGGEVLLAADRTQNIYGVPPWTDEAMKNAGFRGEWVTLVGSYRLPERLMGPAGEFIRRFLPDADSETPVRPKDRTQGNMVRDLHMHWTQFSPDTGPDELAAEAFRECQRLVESSRGRPGEVTPADVVFLVCSNKPERRWSRNCPSRMNAFFQPSATRRRRKASA